MAPNTDDAKTSRPAGRFTIGRWAERLIVTFLINAAVFVLYPNLICGCHFWYPAAALSLVPVAWAGYCFLAYRTLRERIIGWLNILLAVAWLYLAWDSNIQFAFL